MSAKRRKHFTNLRLKGWWWLLALAVMPVFMGLTCLLVVLIEGRPLTVAMDTVTLHFVPQPYRGLLMLTYASLLMAVVVYQWEREARAHAALLRAEAAQARAVEAAPPDPPEPQVPQHVVALGGGHGLSTLLRGLKNRCGELTAIVTVADDGGSSGALRRDMGMLPPGDLRRCIAALADAEPLMTQLFQYRFGRGTGLDGHTFGNLFIAAMAGITGDFESAISEASRVLAVRGRILPSSLDNLVLSAEVRDPLDPDAAPHILMGESAIGHAEGVIERVFLEPEQSKGYPAAIQALLSADLIVLGPGSLYTSILPNLLVPDIAAAVRASAACKIYVCNVATQPGETDGYTVGDHVRALNAHLGMGLCHCVLANGNYRIALPPASPSTMVRPEFEGNPGCQLVLEDLVDARLPWRHDSTRLADALLRMYHNWRVAAQLAGDPSGDPLTVSSLH